MLLYDEPRETSMVELASLLDLSPTAVGGQLRRSSARLIEDVLLDDDRE
ncbi:helix-turn-helix domain-containing protein [Natronorubrum sulfidifaciens]|nr:helix-turn-helix domain-containing protein [Natronorubrum sulfidifaciens]